MALARNGLRTDRSDARLVTAVRCGDKAAFEALYERHHAAILSFCRHLTGRREDAEDAVQHTFMAAYRELSASDGELALKPWLFTVARNRCLSLLRARRVREHNARLHSESLRFDGLNDEVERREDLRALVSDLGRLPEPQRAALVMSELEALTHAEIGKVLGIEAGKVRSLVFQARSSLISTREARNTSCGEIRMQLSTMRGASLRRRTLRRHVHECEGCRDFEMAVRLQRRDLALILPVTAGAGLREGAVSAAACGSGASAAGGAAGAAALGGGGAAAAGAGGGILGGLSAVQVTLTVVVAAGSVSGFASADVPARLGLAEGRSGIVRDGDARGPAGRFVAVTRGSPEQREEPEQGEEREQSDEPARDERPARDNEAGDMPSSPGRPDAERAGEARGRAPEAAGDQRSGSGGPAAIPPGLAKKGATAPPSSAAPPSHSNGRAGGAPPGHTRRPGAAGGGPPGQVNRPAGAPGQEKRAVRTPAPVSAPSRPDHPAAPPAEAAPPPAEERTRPGEAPGQGGRPADPGKGRPPVSNGPQK